MPVSMYVIADLDTEEGMGLVKEALTYLVRIHSSLICSPSLFSFKK